MSIRDIGIPRLYEDLKEAEAKIERLEKDLSIQQQISLDALSLGDLAESQEQTIKELREVLSLLVNLKRIEDGDTTLAEKIIGDSCLGVKKGIAWGRARKLLEEE